MTAARAPSIFPRLLLLPWLILVAMLGTTWAIWDHERQNTRKELRTQFDFALRETVSRIEQRIGADEQMLRGVQGLFATTSLTNRQAIRDYVAMLQIDTSFSGVQDIGFVEYVPAARKAQHVEHMRRTGFPDYQIKPDGERAFYTPVIQREPDTIRNRVPLGFDPWSEPARRLAMEKSRDSGNAAITGNVRLALDKDGQGGPSFIMYLPIYAKGQPRDTVIQRRAALIGWTYAGFHMHEFIASLYGRQMPGLIFSLYDGANPSAATRMYHSTGSPDIASPAAANRLSTNEYMVVAGHTWTLTLSTQDEFEARFGREVAWLIATIGIGLSLSMALLAWFMVTGRARALRLAAGMTEELRHMAQHDPLTGLPNRTLFSDRVAHELAYAKRNGKHFAMIFLDLDNFKPINDNFGHAVGDRMLQQVARRLQDAVRSSDTVGRIGGDEFVVLMTDLSGAEGALSLAEKIRRAVRHTALIDDHALTVSCSIGVAIYPEDGVDEISLTKSADEAMYRAKEDGRDKVLLAS